MIVDIARSWIGTPFKHQGRIKGRGVDCIGLAVGISNELGVAVRDRHDYGRIPTGDDLLKALNEHGEEIDKMEVGAVVLMRMANTEHLAIISKVNPVYIIHAYQPAGKVIEVRLDKKMERRVRKIYRFNQWHR